MVLLLFLGFSGLALPCGCGEQIWGVSGGRARTVPPPSNFPRAANTGCRVGLRGPICRHSGLGGDSTLYLCRVQEFIPSWDTREPGAHSGRVSSDRTDGRGPSSLSLYNLPSCARNSSMKENLVQDEDRALLENAKLRVHCSRQEKLF